ncbi:uncharacterized protein ACBT44_010723 isoform 1-T3 [Syngnathus typhle]
MATFVHCASCYAHSSVQPLHMFGKGPDRGNYMSLFTYRGPRYAPRPRLPRHAPNMTLWQICHMLKLMKQVRKREAAAARFGSIQETVMCRPDTGLLRHQVGEEMYPELYQTQAQCKTCLLIH